jgi:uncharacterized membrane protein YbaN (DUF454 family)
MNRLVRNFYILLGWQCLGLGFVGIFLPILPTTPFVLLAAFCFSRGSDNLYQWLLRQKSFGPLIHYWCQHGVIRRHVKWTATLLITLLMSYPVFFSPLAWFIKVGLALIGLCVIGFICSRPSSI